MSEMIWSRPKSFPQVDLSKKGGHLHHEEPGKKVGKSTWFVQSGSHGKYIARITATIDTKRRRVENITSRLIAVKESTPELSSMKKAVERELKEVKKFGWNQVGILKNGATPLERNQSNSGLSELYSRAISKQHKVEIVMQSASSDYALPAGKITEWGLFRTYPYEDTVCLMSLTKQQLTEIIKEQLDKDRDKRFLSPYGIIVTIDKKNRVTDIKLEDGSPWKKGQRKIVAVNSYSVSSAGRRFPVLKKIAMIKSVNARDTNKSVRDTLRTYIKKDSPVSINAKQRIRSK